MGAKFTHTHVRTSNADAVADALCELAGEHRLSHAADGEPADVEIVVATDPASPAWTSIYGGFDSISWELTIKIPTHAVVLTVFDGDTLEARLFNDGCKVDIFCTDPEFAEEPARAVKGQPRRWDSLCVVGKNWRDVQRVFKSAAENVEWALVELGKIIGLDRRSLYPDHIDPAGPAVRRLRFKRPPTPRRRIVGGPPSLSVSGDDEVFLKMSAGPRQVGIGLQNHGGPANGIEAAFGGAALASGLIAIEAVEYRTLLVAPEQRHDDGVWHVATFPAAGISAASGPAQEGSEFAEIADGPAYLAVNWKIVPLRAGEGELTIRCTPIDPATSPCVQTCRVRIEAT